MKKSMKWCCRAMLFFCTLVLPPAVNAAQTAWEGWIDAQIKQHPEVVAARQQWLGSGASADALEKPLHNPELSVEGERIGEENNYRIGFQQTVDWWDQRGAMTEQARFERQAAAQHYRSQVMIIKADTLTALVEWQAAVEAARIARELNTQLDGLLQLVEKRQRAGDLGRIDAELTFLNLSQGLTTVAETEAELKKAEARVGELLPEWSAEQDGIPEAFWTGAVAQADGETLAEHPLVAGARAEWQAMAQVAEVTQRQARAEPTLGINAGRDAGESAVGLTLSIPLHLRNDYSAETRAERQAALEAEARFHSRLRKQRYAWQAAFSTWQEFDRQYRRWQEVMQGRVERSAVLLEKQWRSGDLPTSDYLLALNQRAEGLMAGITLALNARRSRIDALLQAGRIDISALVGNQSRTSP